MAGRSERALTVPNARISIAAGDRHTTCANVVQFLLGGVQAHHTRPLFSASAAMTGEMSAYSERSSVIAAV